MNEQQMAESRELYEDHMERMAEEHVLRTDPESSKDYTPPVNDVAVRLADALRTKHGSYPGALLHLCGVYVDQWGEPSIEAMIESIYRDIETDGLF